MQKPRFNRTFMAIGLAGLIASSGFALAGEGSHWGKKHHHANPEKMVEHLSKKLDLTATQKDELAALFSDRHTRTSGLKEEMRSLRKQLHSATDGATYDEQQVRQIASRMADLTEQLTLEMAQGRQALWQLLTPEQQEAFGEMQAKREEKRAEWRNKTS